LKVEQKGPQDPVSEADRAAETLIREWLGRAFPGDGFLGEEGGGTTAERLWVIDPIDGTANFVRGMPSFCVSLAYVEDGASMIGIIYAPVTDELFAARRGSGATCNGAPIRASGCTVPSEAIIGLSYTHKQPRAGFLAVLDRMLAAGSEFRRIGSTTLGLAYVAAGRLDAFWAPRTQSWDVLAGLLLVQEAGGWASDFLSEHGALKPGDAFGCAAGLRRSLAQMIA
jgi:myo-inositol-1(or 4)-monophosphatase